jgi:hypothetical protein
MNIDELCWNVYEDLEGWIKAVRETQDGLEIIYECDNWKGSRDRLSFSLLCKQVKESSVLAGESGSLSWTDNHPVLLHHNVMQSYLYFSSIPSDPFEIIGILYEAHENIFHGWRRFSDCLHSIGGATSTLLSSGHGLLASGPEPALKKLREVISDRLTTNIVDSYLPKDIGYKALILDRCFVVCRNVVVSEIDQ